MDKIDGDHSDLDVFEVILYVMALAFAPLAFAPAMEQWAVPHAADVLEAVKRTVARA